MGIPGGTFAEEQGIEPKIAAELFLRPGLIVQRHTVSYPADGCHPSADKFWGEFAKPCEPRESNADCVSPSKPRCKLVLQQPPAKDLPSLKLHGATSVGLCDGLQVDAIVSWGAGSRKVLSYVWTVLLIGSARAPLAVEAATEKMNAPAAECNARRVAQGAEFECAESAGSARLEIAADTLPPGEYRVGCTVTTFLGLSQSASTVVVKNVSHTIPQVKILGANPYKVRYP